MSVCHVCLGFVDDGELYHSACCQKLFGQPQPPEFPYSWSDLNSMAEKIVSQSIVIPGVQPKLSLLLKEGDKGRESRLTIVGLEGNLIMKPPVLQYPEMPELEHLVMRLAGLFEIKTAVCGLLPMASGELCYITRRMDRSGTGKLHMEDFCQITDNLTTQKYHGGSMEKVAKTVLRHCTNTGLDALRLFELTVFCFLTGKSDMHLKNFSVLHDGQSGVTLSPAYDLLPVKLLLPEDNEEMALPMLGKKRNFQWEHFERWATEYLSLNPIQIKNVRTRFTTALDQTPTQINRSFATQSTREKLINLIKERAFRLGFN